MFPELRTNKVKFRIDYKKGGRTKKEGTCPRGGETQHGKGKRIFPKEMTGLSPL